MLLLALAVNGYAIAQSGTWTWLRGDSTGGIGNPGIMGVASPTNDPPATYQAAYWLDLQGNFWIFSGVNGMNDNKLWKYNPTTNQ